MSLTKTINEASSTGQFLQSNASVAMTHGSFVTIWEQGSFGFPIDGAYHAIRQKIQSFKKFKKNWDGYNAGKIHPGAIRQSLHFIFVHFELSGLIPSSVAPTRDGGVAIEYKFDSIKLVYRILATKRTLVVIKNNSHVVSTVNLNSNRHSAETFANPIVVYRTIVTNLL